MTTIIAPAAVIRFTISGTPVFSGRPGVSVTPIINNMTARFFLRSIFTSPIAIRHGGNDIRHNDEGQRRKAPRGRRRQKIGWSLTIDNRIINISIADSKTLSVKKSFCTKTTKQLEYTVRQNGYMNHRRASYDNNGINLLFTQKITQIHSVPKNERASLFVSINLTSPGRLL